MLTTTPHAKRIIILQFILIVLLLSIIAYPHFKDVHPSPKNDLLSPRISTGILQPKSLLVMNYAPLRQYFMKKYVENGYNISIYLVNLRDGASMGINQRAPYSPASLNKIPLAILILKEVEDGDLTLDQLIPIAKENRNNASGSIFQIQNEELPLKNLLEAMLQESDNTAYLILNKYIDPKDFEFFLWNYFGYFEDEVKETGQIIRTDNAITAKNVYAIFSSLYLSTVLSSEHSQYLLSLLTKTNFDIKKITELPEEVIVAHKYALKEDGSLSQFHDCGILYIKEMRLFYCVMTKDLTPEEGIKKVAEIVKSIYAYSINTRQFYDEYAIGKK